MMSLQIPPAPPAKRSTNWRESEVMDLLDIWGEEDIQQALRTTRRNQAVYERIASEMTLRGHNRDWHQCRAKAKVLKAHYKKAREANRAGGGCKVTCAYYEELSQILEEDDSTEALYIVDIGGNPQATEISDASDREEKEDTPVLTPIIIKEEALEIQEESPSSQETSDEVDIKPPAPFWQDIHLTSHQTGPSALCLAASSSQPTVPSTFPTPGHLPTVLSQTPPSGAPQLTTAGQASPSPGPSCLGMQTDWLGTPPLGPGEMSISSEHKSLGKQVTSNLQTLSPIIELNVGGEMYITTLSTLKKHPGSKLAEMFTGQPKLRTDSEGRYFIDRPGTYFKYILEYLRSNQVPTQCVQDVYKEALYYDIEPLIKQLEDSPQIFGELVARKQFLARVPSYSENIELMIRIARAEAVASRQSSVMVCVVRTEEDVAKCHEALNSLDTDKKSVVKFGPWKATPTVSDLLDCIKMDVEAKGYNVSIQPHVAEKGFRFKSYDFFYKFVFTWW